MAGDVRIVLDQKAIELIAAYAEVRDFIADQAQPIADDAGSRAPKRTGAGAEGIHVEMVLEAGVWEARISWDTGQPYMKFQELGTSDMRPRSFLRTALEARALSKER